MEGNIMGKEKRNKQSENSMDELLRRQVTDILLSTVLLCCAAVLLLIYFKAPNELVIRKSYNALALVFPLADIAVAAALFFKGGFFRWFSLTAITAKLKGIDRKRVYPTQMYIMSVKIFALMLCLTNIIFMILVIRIIM